jgi:hypothetical protein
MRQGFSSKQHDLDHPLPLQDLAPGVYERLPRMKDGELEKGMMAVF